MGCFLHKGFFVVGFYLLLLCGCNTPSDNPSSTPNYIDSSAQRLHLNYADSAHYFAVIDSLYNSMARPDDNALWDKYYYRMRYFYFYKRDYGRSLVYTDSLLQTCGQKTLQSRALYARAMLLRGDVLLDMARYNDAFYCYYQAREQIIQTGDSCSFASYTTTLARISYHQHKYLDAAHYHILALKERIPCNDGNFGAFAEEQGTLDNIGLCYSRQGITDSAAYYFNAALQYIDQNGSRFANQADFMASAKAVVWGNQAEIATLQGNDSAAQRLLQQSIAINRLPQNAPEDAVYSRVKLAKLFLKHNNLPAVGKVLAECTVAMDTIHNNELLLQLSLLQSRYAAALHNTGRAFTWLAKYNRQKDSLATLAAPITSADIQASFSNIERKNELQQLNQKSTVQKIYIIVLSLVAVMAMAIILLALKNSRQAKKHINTLRLTLDVLEKTQQDNSRLVNAVAHDLRSPISAMANFAKLTLDETPETSPTHKLLGVILSTGKSALELITDLLHIQTTTALLPDQRTDLQELLEYCIALLQHKAAEKQQQIVLQAGRVSIPGDREKLWRVFSNLISNAIKFSMPQALIMIRVQVEKAKVTVLVEDRGIGIPENLQADIFTLSGKSKRKGTAGEASFGLGLVICKQIVELHKGKIWFVTTPGTGTTFFVELPAA